MSKNSRKLWKAYLHFPYDLTKLHTFEKSLSIYSHVNFIHPKSSHLGYSCPLISNTALLHLPLVKAYALTMNPCSDLAQRSMQTRRFNLITAIPFSPKPHHRLHICLQELATFRTPTANKSPRTLKRHKDQEKVHVCSSVQESSSYVLQLGLKKTKKVKWKTVHLTAG